MPKKTKKEKILAEQRRKHINIETIKPVSSYSLKIPPKENAKTATDGYFKLNIFKQQISSARQDEPNVNYNYVYKDLLRITIFSTLAISLQFVLVWLLRTK